MVYVDVKINILSTMKTHMYESVLLWEKYAHNITEYEALEKVLP